MASSAPSTCVLTQEYSAPVSRAAGTDEDDGLVAGIVCLAVMRYRSVPDGFYQKK